jgi:DHA2 family multidrug resistance protein
LGGWISYDYHWPWIFYINIPVGILSMLWIYIYLRSRETQKERAVVDWFGLFLLATGVACLQFLLDKGEQYDWMNSDLMRTMAVASVVAFTLLIVWCKSTSTPLIELALFKIPSFALSVFYIALAYAIYFGSVVLVPLWLQTNMGYTPIWAGLAVAPIGIAPFLLSTTSGRLVNKYGSLPLLGLCFVLFAISCFYTAYFDTSVDIYHIAFSRFLLGCALVFFISPLFSLSLSDVSNEKLASATGIFHFVRAMFGGVGTSVFTTIWIRRSAYHHATVGENITAFSQQTQDYLAQLKTLGFEGLRALHMLNRTLDKEAAMLSINDCFYFMGWIFIGLLFFLPLGRRKKATVLKFPPQ